MSGELRAGIDGGRSLASGIEMAKRITIFFSWQSDSPRATNHSFIEDCLERAIKELKRDEELKVEPVLDRDTRGVPDSPDIGSTIFGKIRESQVFVGDVSIINPGGTGRPTPNPNVLIELGYALCCLGNERVVCVCNEASGSIEDLPFDLRQKRVCKYRLEQGQDKVEPRKALAAALREAIRLILDTPDPEVAADDDRFFAELADRVINLLILGEELEQRSESPWVGEVRSRFEAVAFDLRRKSLEDAAARHDLGEALEAAAGALDEATAFQMYQGGWGRFSGLVAEVVRQVNDIKTRAIDPRPVAAEDTRQARADVVALSRELQALARRMETMLQQNRLRQLQMESSGIGLRLLRLCHQDLGTLRPGLLDDLRQVGKDLHLVETMPVYQDGGDSVRAILDRVRHGDERLAELVQPLEAERRDGA